MTVTVTLGRRLVPLEHIALIEPFDPATQTRIQSDRPFRARIVMINRDSVLTEEALDAFAERYAFRMLSEDGIATNPLVHFTVESYERREGFTPTKPYRSRLMWRDLEGTGQSKLLLSEAEVVLAITVRGEVPATAGQQIPAKTRRRKRRPTTPAPL